MYGRHGTYGGPGFPVRVSHSSVPSGADDFRYQALHIYGNVETKTVLAVNGSGAVGCENL